MEVLDAQKNWTRWRVRPKRIFLCEGVAQGRSKSRHAMYRSQLARSPFPRKDHVHQRKESNFLVDEGGLVFQCRLRVKLGLGGRHDLVVSVDIALGEALHQVQEQGVGGREEGLENWSFNDCSERSEVHF